MSLFSHSVLFAHHLFECPEKALKLLNKAFEQAAIEICHLRNLKSDVALKRNIHVRLTALPNIPEINRTNLPDCSDIGQFMCISGTIIRGTTSKMLEYRKLWKCKKCKFDFTIDAEVECGYVSEKPVVCPNPEWCNGKNFALLSSDVNPSFCKDYQEVKIQEQVYNLTVGSVPKSMWVILEDDLVDSCQPGNDVNVSGVLIQRWKPLAKSRFMDIDLVLLAHNVEVKNKLTPGIVSANMVQEFAQYWIDNKDDLLKARDIILSSICPQVFGLYIVKLAVALVLAGGVEKKDAHSRIRGDSHLLLVGDPGTGKSQFLKYATKVSTRSVITSGIGTTNAGLTVSAVKDSGKWQLEAGALVLADGGICCIDEFSCIKEHDKTCIHEAMEQQTISVAKAGLVCSLSTRCAILAATNPKGKYDSAVSISENTALASPLLSRFDVILVLLDISDENWDTLVSSYILEGRNLSSKTCSQLWSLEKMRHYFSLVRYISPKVTPSCEKILQTYYKRQRRMESRNFARTTPRLLQSLIRLAEGHARLMFRDQVLTLDAVMAIILMESSMSGSSVLDNLPTIHTSFPENPKENYYSIEKMVLNLLNLDISPIDYEGYARFYDESCLRRILSDLSINFKLCKLDLFEKSSFSGSKSKSCVPTSTQLRENTYGNFASSDDVETDFNTKDLSLNDHVDKTEILNSTKLPKSATVSAFFETRVNNEFFQGNGLTSNDHRKESITDEISTLSAIGKIFCDNMGHPDEKQDCRVKEQGESHNKRKHHPEFPEKIMSSDSETNVHENIEKTKTDLTENFSSKLKSFKKFNFQSSKETKTNIQTDLESELETNETGVEIKHGKDPFSESDIQNCKFKSKKFVATAVIETIESVVSNSGKTEPMTLDLNEYPVTPSNDELGRKESFSHNLKKFSFKGRPKKNQIEVKVDVHAPPSSDANQYFDEKSMLLVSTSDTNSEVIRIAGLKTNSPSVPVINSHTSNQKISFNNNTPFLSKDNKSNSRPLSSQSTFKKIFSNTVQNDDIFDLTFEDIGIPAIKESNINISSLISDSSKTVNPVKKPSGSTQASQAAFKRILTTSGQNIDNFDLDLDDPLF